MRSDTSDAPSTHAPAAESASESKEESKVETKAEPVEHAAEASTSTDAPAPAPVHSDETKAMLDSTTAHKEEKGE